MKPRLLDLCCGAGGAAMGYARAGFDVTGVDINRQPNFPFEFFQADAVAFLREHGHEYDAIHASPPCQRYSKSVSKANRSKHPQLIEPLRELLVALGKPYVIENVPGAPLLEPVTLCGSSFHLLVRRHRLFESNVEIPALECRHAAYKPRWAPAWNRTNPLRFVPISGGWTKDGDHELNSCAMGVTWDMTPTELSESIPPAYTEHIGHALMLELSL